MRESYPISSNPKISIKIYKGIFEGFIRVEVEFESETNAKSFIIPNWFDKEITGTALSKDSRMIFLSDSEFKNILSIINKN